MKISGLVLFAAVVVHLLSFSGYCGISVKSQEVYKRIESVSSEGIVKTSDEGVFILTRSDLIVTANNYNDTDVYMIYYERDGKKYCFSISNESKANTIETINRKSIDDSCGMR